MAGDEAPAKVLRTPHAAGVAGILSALLLGGAMVLVHKAMPRHPGDAVSWLADDSNRRSLRTALFLFPFGGVAFLWFMGALRDFAGAGEDRFFATVFLGSGVLFVAMIFVFGATASAFLATVDALKTPTQQIESFHYGRYLTFSLLTQYAPRMAGVFTLTTTSIGTRLGILPRWLTLLGYLVGLTLLFLVRNVTWTELAFPVWVLVVGCFLVIRKQRPTA